LKSNGITVRPMVAGDAPEVARLATQLGYPSSGLQIEKRWETVCSSPDAKALVATDPQDIVLGWIHVFATRMLESDSVAEIGGLVVDEGARGRGIGTILVAAAEAWAIEHGFSAVTVRSNVIRKEAHAFYQRLGYDVQKSQVKFRKTLPLPVPPR
jgi:GNAT superfamily N-acetyltransferase